MMRSQKILVTIQNNIGVITLNHPEKNNCLSQDIMADLVKIYRDLENTAAVKIIILNANGKHFCAGADLSHMEAMKKASYEENAKDARTLAQFFYDIYICQKPTICCVHGKSMGGGVGLLAVHDIVVATRDALFCFPEITIGLMPAVIAPFVTQRIGYSQAKHHMLTADMFTAEKALHMKLIDEICEQSAIDYGLSLAKTLVKNNLIAMQKTKQWLQTLYPITSIQLDQAAQFLAEIRQVR